MTSKYVVKYTWDRTLKIQINTHIEIPRDQRQMRKKTYKNHVPTFLCFNKIEVLKMQSRKMMHTTIANQPWSIGQKMDMLKKCREQNALEPHIFH